VEPEAIVAALAATADRLRALFADLPDERAVRAPAPGEWSAAEALAHLRACDAIIAPRVWQILVRPGVRFPGMDEPRWRALSARSDEPLAAQLAAFLTHRAELVALLRTLTPEEWETAGEHEELGPVTIRVLMDRGMVQHEAEHLAQIELLLA
jgi:transposase